MIKHEEIIPLVKQRIPTIVGYDSATQSSVIGDAARLAGLNSKTTVFNFKPAFGMGDKEFSETKKYWYSGLDATKHSPHIETFTAKEAALRFLNALLVAVPVPDKLIVGEPAIRERVWKENFRRHIREVFSTMKLAEPAFFPEPFAVFQYYRHIDKTLPITNRAEIILIIDIGGGTFNSCIIRTTEEGLLARGGATALPLGLQAEVCGGAEIDKEVLKIVVMRSRATGTKWKEDPLQRIQSTGSPALLLVEDAKIRLSEEMSKQAEVRLSTDFSHLKVPLYFPKGELHPEVEIRQSLTGEDLKKIIRGMWRRHWGPLICHTVNEAQQKLKSAVQLSLDKIDRVLIAGGSSRLPFIKEELLLVLPNHIDRQNIYLGSDSGEAVAFGIACECREQARRDPRLSVNKISPCVLNDLHLGFKQTRRGPFLIPNVRKNGQLLPDGQLLSGPFETEELRQTYEIEVPFNVGDRLFYYFGSAPLRDETESVPLNLIHDVLAVPPLGKIGRKCQLTLDIKPDGLIKPLFTFRGKGTQIGRKEETVECPEFFFEGFQIKSGKSYIGLDFGNSNSYLVRFVSIPKAMSATQYPAFTLQPETKQRLRELQLRLASLGAAGVFDNSRLLAHANDQMLELIFHSLKIEGSPLTKGETADLLDTEANGSLTPNQQEAKNLECAYKWMLENLDACLTSPEAFVRQLNATIMQGVASHCGEYRKGSVRLSGMDFVPPPAGSVSAFMRQLSDEIRSGGEDRSALECAVAMHTKLVWIHPFSDGNGRTARILLNAYLLSQGLPAIVINHADRERYLHCLEESNGGDLSPLLEFMLDCFEEQLEGLQEASRPRPSDASAVLTPATESSEIDPLTAVLEDVGVREAGDPLAAIMQKKVVEHQKTIEAEYDAWKQSILTIPAEFKAIVEAFDANDIYRDAGYWMRCQVYDLLTLEKYIAIATRRPVSKTWFVGLELTGPQSRERSLWFFNGASPLLRRDTSVSKVSLAVSRLDGARYTRFTSEPINLREIGYRHGTLLFVSREGKVESGNIRNNLQTFLADIIRGYL